jgi:acyl carrier protein
MRVDVDFGLVVISNRCMSGSPDDRVLNIVQRLLTERSITAMVGPDDNLLEAGLNSLDILNLVLSLEAEFDMPIPEAEITPANLLTISGICGLISGLVNHS